MNFFGLAAGCDSAYYHNEAKKKSNNSFHDEKPP
jgi:hypothetical protein